VYLNEVVIDPLILGQYQLDVVYAIACFAQDIAIGPQQITVLVVEKCNQGHLHIH
jgi:hypothetical protein